MNCFRYLAIVMVIVAVLCPLAGHGQEIGLRTGEVKGPVEITADVVEHDRAANTYTARGSVVVKETTRTVWADYIFLDDTTRDITAVGHVVYEDQGDRIEAEQMQLNLETKKGTLEKARVFIKTGNVYVNQSAAYSDYHATGANPAATASYTDSAFVATRFRVVQRRWHAAA